MRHLKNSTLSEQAAKFHAVDLTSIAFLRFIAASWVFFFHAAWGGFFSLDDSNLLKKSSIIAIGYSAVSFFFVLSGFILACVYLERKQSQKRNFYLARFARIYPVYLLGLLIALPFPILHLFHKIYHLRLVGHDISVSGLWMFFPAIADALLLTRAWTVVFNPIWNPPAWSLSCEAFFYAIFPYTIRILARASNSRLWLFATLVPILGLALNSVVCFGLHMGDQQLGTNPTWYVGILSYVAEFNPLLRTHEFLIGAILGVLAKRGQILEKLQHLGMTLRILLCASLACLALYTTMISPYLIAHNGISSIFWAGFLAILVSLPTILKGRVTDLLGGASYSLYLIQFPILQTAGLLAEKFGAFANHLYWTFLVSYVLSVVLSIAIYKYYETPLRQTILSRFGSSRLANQSTPIPAIGH